jgi:hypothetical protein
MPENKDRWSVEYRDQVTGTWHTDTSGPRVFYGTREDAMAWAAKLHTIQARVRLQHEIITYESLP